MRVITVMRDGVPSLKAVESCNVPITMLRRTKLNNTIYHIHFSNNISNVLVYIFIFIHEYLQKDRKDFR